MHSIAGLHQHYFRLDVTSNSSFPIHFLKCSPCYPKLNVNSVKCRIFLEIVLKRYFLLNYLIFIQHQFVTYLIDFLIFILHFSNVLMKTYIYSMVKSIRPSDGNIAQNLFFRPTDKQHNSFPGLFIRREGNNIYICNRNGRNGELILNGFWKTSKILTKSKSINITTVC